MGRAIFAQANAVMSKDKNNWLAHERRHAQGRSHIIREDQKGAAIGPYATMQGQAVKNAAMPCSAGTEMDVVAVARIAGVRPLRLWARYYSRAWNQRPPNTVGIRGTMASKIWPEAARVANGLSTAKVGNQLLQSAGNSPANAC